MMFNNIEVWQKINEFLQIGELLMILVIRFIDYMVMFDFNDIKGMIFGFMKLINKVLNVSFCYKY